jgi:hypothetical protein
MGKGGGVCVGGRGAGICCSTHVSSTSSAFGIRFYNYCKFEEGRDMTLCTFKHKETNEVAL